MTKLTIDGKEIEVPAGSTVLQACELAGKEIPIFCFHPRLNIAGNCRMCLVEMERSPKPIASCAMPAGDGMVIKTDTPLVHRARKGVLEFLLINHPLDCPICDQGGECDLQDLTLFYGPDHSRFKENKRSVVDKNLGPLISTHMNRCIQCTRCIRFLDEIAGVEELGMVHRGEHEEISTWIERALHSELQGNIIDLCPVGALNSKPYEYRARPWELRKTESVDVLDAVGCNIRRDAFAAIGQALAGVPGERIAAIVGDLVDCEAMVVLKDLMARLGSPHLDCRQDGTRLDPSARCSYLFNTTIAGVEQADLCLLIGTNPRYEAPLVNVRIRKRMRQGGFTVARIGPPTDLTYRVVELGAGPTTLSELADGAHEFCQRLEQAARPMLILGQGALARPDGGAILASARALAERYGMVQGDWCGFNVLHTAAARVGGLDLGLVPGKGGRDVAGILEAAGKGEIEVVFLLG